MVQRFTYRNDSTEQNTFTIVSQHPNILQILDPKVVIGGFASEHIRIKVPKRDKLGLAEVLLFVTDQDEKTFETILFRLTFTN